MTAQIISGKQIAENLIENSLKPRVAKLNAQGIQPKLVVILVGNHSASASYVRQKEKFATKAGILSEVRRYEDTISEAEILDEIKQINADDSIHGVIVQLPLPDHISVTKVLQTIAPAKDVDGFTPENIGKLFLGEPCLQCCTPKGIITMIEDTIGDMTGKNICVIGRSNIVGKPVAALALNKRATVTVCHSKTKDIKAKMADADIIIVAVGRPEMFTGDDFPKGAVIIDVGIHRKDAPDTERGWKLCGDVEFESAKNKVAAISPVPGGVGPMTVASLIENTVEAAETLANN
ncbi:bifunctional 5,10-methylene-tetrahydrofolate dehydrogenase/5,10-methylene-tetrahydrofolate cyclohydrolase [bacterium DOLZORAL124_38_8]|nr:MAG: bifunctional 5,10-methylene-tetrahydrofolate dehydrogenase/5,10-methylene-tetrahydrofolate cyclohydrolase [bacterium DOLZORAL124_38_8]